MSRISAPKGPEHDNDPPRDPALGVRPYLVCCTARSGSGLLCRGLASTGAVGLPAEYFSLGRRPQLAARWGAGPELRDYAAALLGRRSNAAGIFGAKMMWGHLVRIRAEVLEVPRSEPEFEISADFLEELLPAPLYIHLSRRDVNRQAISQWRAMLTGDYNRPADDPQAQGDVPYDFAGIDRCRREIVLHEVHWDRFFRFNGIEPIRLTYEELVADYDATVAGLVTRIAPEAGTVAVPPAPGRKLGDTRSEVLLDLFLADLEQRGQALSSASSFA